MLDAPGANESENDNTPEAVSADSAMLVHTPASANSGYGSGAADTTQRIMQAMVDVVIGLAMLFACLGADSIAQIIRP